MTPRILFSVSVCTLALLAATAPRESFAVYNPHQDSASDSQQKPAGSSTQSTANPIKITLPTKGEIKTLSNGFTLNSSGELRNKAGALVAYIGGNGSMISATGKLLSSIENQSVLGLLAHSGIKVSIAGLGVLKGKDFGTKNIYEAAKDEGHVYYGQDNNKDKTKAIRDALKKELAASKFDLTVPPLSFNTKNWTVAQLQKKWDKLSDKEKISYLKKEAEKEAATISDKITAVPSGFNTQGWTDTVAQNKWNKLSQAEQQAWIKNHTAAAETEESATPTDSTTAEDALSDQKLGSFSTDASGNEFFTDASGKKYSLDIGADGKQHYFAMDGSGHLSISDNGTLVDQAGHVVGIPPQTQDTGATATAPSTDFPNNLTKIQWDALTPKQQHDSLFGRNSVVSPSQASAYFSAQSTANGAEIRDTSGRVVAYYTPGTATPFRNAAGKPISVTSAEYTAYKLALAKNR